ncbi:MAG: transposase, partial [Acetobacteraceae bacterium]|nr:transposase [Acetobacteraceae bacterium]
MPRRRIGQEMLGFGAEAPAATLDRLHDLIDWPAAERALAPVRAAAKGEAAWPPLSLFKALLIAVWHDLSDVKLAEALDDRSSFRRFCGFARHEAVPERTAFVR